MTAWQTFKWVRTAVRLSIAIGIAMVASSPVHAQSIWELTPYQITTWVAAQNHPLSPQDALAELDGQISRSVQSSLGAVWKMEFEDAPMRYRSELLALEQPQADQLLTDSPEVDTVDKLFALVILVRDNGYRINVSELDVRTRVWSSWRSRHANNWAQVGDIAFQLMCETFVPLAQIRRVADEQVTALVKAGALVRPESSVRRWAVPTEIEVGDVLQPIIRRTDRNGKVKPGGAKPIQWTVLVVEDRKDGELTCKTLSGYKQPFNARRSSRVEQLALLIRPEHESTKLRLTNRRKPEEPLVGYDIYARPPGAETSEFVGRTNWQGSLEIPSDAENPVRVLFVKSGNQLLGKLPVVPGQQQELTAPLRNDDRRLEAEGFLLGIKESLIDLVARREVLSNRIRVRIEDGKLDEAEQLLEQLKGLDTQEDFARRIQQRKQSLTAVDSQVQQHIDKLFADTRTLLGQFLDPERAQQLQTMLDEARRKQG